MRSGRQFAAMKHLLLSILAFHLIVDLMGQSTGLKFQYFIKLDSTYVIVDDAQGNWYTFEIERYKFLYLVHI